LIHWFKYTIGLIITSSTNLLFNYAAAVSLRWLTDASVNKDLNALVKSVISFGVGILLIAAIIPFFMYAFDSSVKKITGDIRKRLFDHIQNLPVKNIEDRHSADFISRLTNDVQTFENAYSSQISMVLSSLISGVGSIIIMFSMNIKLSIVGISLGLLTTCINILYVKPLKKISDEVQNSLSQVTQKFADILSGNSVVKMFNLYEYVQNRFDNTNTSVRKWSMKRVLLNSYLGGTNNFLGFGSFVGITAFGCYLALKGETTFGTIIAVSQMLNGLVWMFNSIGSYLTQLQGSLAGGDRIQEILYMPLEIPSEFKFFTAVCVGQNRTLDIWSVSILFCSSGIAILKLLKPASM
jgi:ATP-binding cassette subfamily B protein